MKKLFLILFLAFLAFMPLVGLCAKETPIKVNGMEIEAPPVEEDARYNDEKMKQLKKFYSGVTKDEKIILALETLKGGLGEFSRSAILGENLSGKPIKVEFKDLSLIHQQYKSFDALGWSKKKRLYIYINEKHKDAPSEALGALLSHEALHQDELNSINEETYAWTLEAAVWTQFCENDDSLVEIQHPLVVRENTLKNLFEKGNYTDKYIRKTVTINPGYQNLPSRSPGFEDVDYL